MLADAHLVGLVGTVDTGGADFDPPGHERVAPLGGLLLGDHRPHRLGDQRRIHRQLVGGQRLGKEGVVDPEVGDEIHGLGLEVPLGVRTGAHDARERLGGQFLPSRLGGPVGALGREGATLAAAHRQGDHTCHQNHLATHRTPQHQGKNRWAHTATCRRARTNEGTSGSPPSRSSRNESGTVRRTSAASCTSSSACVRPAIRGVAP